MRKELPVQPTAGATMARVVARSVVAATPFAFVNEIEANTLERQIEECMNFVVQEIKLNGGDIHDFYDPARMIPYASIFAEKIRLAEYEHNIQLLQRFIARECIDDAPSPSRVGRKAALVQYLTPYEILTLSRCVLTVQQQGNEDAERTWRNVWLSADGLVSRFKLTDEHALKCDDALAVLAGRGLLVQSGSGGLDGGRAMYRLTFEAFGIGNEAGGAIALYPDGDAV